MPRPATKSQIQDSYVNVVRAIAKLAESNDPQICEVIKSLANAVDAAAQCKASDQLLVIVKQAAKAVQYYTQGKGVEELPIGVMTDAALAEVMKIKADE